MAAAGIDGSGFHTLRRTAATLALQQSASVRDVQAMLGHSSSLMTLTRYAQPDVSQQRAATARVAEAILALAPGQDPDNRPIDRSHELARSRRSGA
ncbi:MAG: tyrosine-type recombinase/integrase [Actinomycetota bacterium]